MRGLVQRVKRAAVTVVDDGVEVVVGRIGPGLCVLVGVTHDDDEAKASKLADKIANMRVFDDDDGVMNRSLLDTASDPVAGAGPGAVLLVSQFTLYGDTRKGRRPSYVSAARPEVAEPLVEAVGDALRELGLEVATGRFRADMDVELINDGPVTLLIDIA